MNIRQFRQSLRDEQLNGRENSEQSGLQDDGLRRIALKAARMGGWAIDLETDTLYWSDEVCEIHDLPPGYQPSLEEGLKLFPESVRAQVLACRWRWA